MDNEGAPDTPRYGSILKIELFHHHHNNREEVKNQNSWPLPNKMIMTK